MTRAERRKRTVLASVTALLALAGTANAFLWLPVGLDGARIAFLPVLAALGVAAALYRPRGGASLGLGTVVVPTTLLLFGPGFAAVIAMVVVLVRQSMARLALPAEERPDVWELLDAAVTVGRAGIATLAAGLVWWRGGVLVGAVTDVFAASVWMGPLTYLLVMMIWDAVTLLWVGRKNVSELLRDLVPFALDAAGWVLGFAIALATRVSGWTSGLILLVGTAWLAVEAQRNLGGRTRVERRLHRIRGVARAGRRVGRQASELGELAARILAECRDVVPSHWSQIAIRDDRGDLQIWRMAPDGALEQRQVDAPRVPPVLPGIHRRAAWKIVEHRFSTEGRETARLHLWCDPRRVEDSHFELLEELLPQLQASLETTLLDLKANRDPLTGLPHRRVLEERLAEAFARCHDEGHALTIVMCDLDHFKQINDTYGHKAGDDVLSQVAALLQRTSRDSDLCTRYGGEEFTLLMEGADGDAALQVAERLRKAAEQAEFDAAGTKIGVTLSLGLASFPELFVENGSDLIPIADAALYEAKREGRNRCYLAVGRGGYRDPEGSTLKRGDAPPDAEAPHIFA